MFRQFYSYVLSKINTYFRKNPSTQQRNNFLKHLKIKRRESENHFEVDSIYLFIICDAIKTPIRAQRSVY